MKPLPTYHRATVLCALIAGVCFLSGKSYAELKVDGPAVIKTGKMARLVANGYEKGAAVLWKYDKTKLDGDRSGNRLLLTGDPGDYVIEATAIRLDKDGNTTVEQYDFKLTISATGPGPGPDPGPTPVGGAAAQVLVVEETGKRTELPADQQAVILGKKFQEYLNTTLPVSNDGKTKNWRIWDKDLNLSNPKLAGWKALMDRPRTSLPWIIIADKDGKLVYEGALPGDPDSAVALVKKYAPKQASKKGK